MDMRRNLMTALIVVLLSGISGQAFGQKYPDGIIDKTIAVVGKAMIMIC